MLVDQMGHRFNLKGTSCNSVHSVSTGVLIEDKLRSSDSVKTFALITSPVTLNRALSSQEEVCKTAAFVSFSQKVYNCAFYVFIPYQYGNAFDMELERILLVRKQNDI